jgi:hypothetical protein
LELFQSDLIEQVSFECRRFLRGILRAAMISLLCKSAELTATLGKWWMELTFVEGVQSGGLCMLLIFIAAHRICSGLFKDDTSSMAHLISAPSTGELQKFGSNTRSFVNQNHS